MYSKLIAIHWFTINIISSTDWLNPTTHTQNPKVTETNLKRENK